MHNRQQYRVGASSIAGRPAAAFRKALPTARSMTVFALAAAVALPDFAADGQRQRFPDEPEGRRPGYVIEMSDDRRAIRIVGLIVGDLSSAVSSWLEHEPQVEKVVLESPGGRFEEATSLARVIFERGLATHVESECQSACTIALVGGKERSAAAGARIGFHRAEVRGPLERLVHPAEATRIAYTQFGLPSEFIDKIVATPPDALWYPTRAELQAANVITSEKPPGEPRRAAKRFVDRDDVLTHLGQQGLFDLFAARYPNEAGAVADRAWADSRRDRWAAESPEPARSALVAAVARLLPLAPDDTLLAYHRLLIDQSRVLSGTHPWVCAEAFLPSRRRTDIGALLPEDLIERERAILADVIVLAEPRHDRRVDEDAAHRILMKADQAAGREHMALFLSLEARRGASPRRICNGIVAALSALVELPPDERRIALRAIYGARLPLALAWTG